LWQYGLRIRKLLTFIKLDVPVKAVCHKISAEIGF
jgi:hypothetical protein